MKFMEIAYFLKDEYVFIPISLCCLRLPKAPRIMACGLILKGLFYVKWKA